MPPDPTANLKQVPPATARRPQHARRLWLPVLIGAVLHFASPLARAQITLNEILADNENAYRVVNEYPDYVELYNASTQAVSLTGLSLTDDPALPRKYVFPAGTSIAGRGYRVVYCTTNRIGTGLRTGFGLGADGDVLRLYAANGVTLLDGVTFGLQAPNLSIGRLPSGTGPWTLTEPTPMATNEAQQLAAPHQLCFNEWMARPSSGEDWLELYNATNLPALLSGLVVTDQPIVPPTNRPIPALSFVGPYGFVRFLASDLQKLDADHLDFKLGSSGETLTLHAANKVTVIDRVTFGSQSANISQGRAPDGSDNIVFFPLGGATPDKPNFAALTNVVISEVLSHTDPPLEDAIELQNVTAASVDISYWWLSDAADQPKKYRIPAGTVLAPGGFKVFYAYQVAATTNGFTLDSSEGDQVYLSVGNASGNLSGAQTFVEFGGLKNGVSVGRHRTTAGVDFVPMSRRSFGVDNPSTLTQFRTGTGLSNAAPRVGPVVISEIMYDPPDVGGQNNADDEFIELHNPTSQRVWLYDMDFPTNRWRLREGVTFDFPANVSVPAGGFLLAVGFDPVANPAQLAAFRTKFSVPAGVVVLGPYDGKLSDVGEGLKLLWPDTPQGPDKPNPGYVPYEQVERVRYASVAPWPAQAAGSGYSLQRLVALSYGNEPTNWFAAAPTAGRAPLADTDGDGMPDEWEIVHGLDPQSNADATGDADGDLLRNYEEFVAGTNPRDPASVLKITALQMDTTHFEVRFAGAAGRSYGLQGLSPALSGAWVALTNLPPLAGDAEVRVTWPRAQGPAQFLRVTIPTGN